jgi:hypothetical protein
MIDSIKFQIFLKEPYLSLLISEAEVERQVGGEPGPAAGKHAQPALSRRLRDSVGRTQIGLGGRIVALRVSKTYLIIRIPWKVYWADPWLLGLWWCWEVHSGGRMCHCKLFPS